MFTYPPARLLSALSSEPGDLLALSMCGGELTEDDDDDGGGGGGGGGEVWICS